jgi:hypothetical protein
VRFWGGSLRTTHTSRTCTRYNDGSAAAPTFEILYLADSPIVALFEVRAMLGSLWIPGGSLAVPTAAYHVATVTVNLHNIVDLTSPAKQRRLRTNAQELTGDWEGYHLRGPLTPIANPVGPAPTQDLGAALHGVPGLEGFVTYSAKVPYHRALIVFPMKLHPGSSLSSTDGDSL